MRVKIPKVRLEELRRVDMFASLDRAALSRIDGCLEDARAESGRPLARAGSVARQMVIVVSGEAREKLGDTEIGTIGPGQLIGALSCLTGQPEPSDVTCAAPLRALVVGRRELPVLLRERRVETAILREARSHLGRLHAGVVAQSPPADLPCGPTPLQTPDRVQPGARDQRPGRCATEALTLDSSAARSFSSSSSINRRPASL